MKKALVLIVCVIMSMLVVSAASADGTCDYTGYDCTALAAELINVRAGLAGFPKNCSCIGQPESCKYTQKGCLALYNKMICLSTALGVDAKLSDQEVKNYLTAYYGVGYGRSGFNPSESSSEVADMGCLKCKGDD